MQVVLPPSLINLLYLFAAILFILGLKGLTHPRTAVRGNLLGALGMFVAVAVTLLAGGLDFKFILIGVAIGAVIGWFTAVKVQMTAMPEMVAIFNGFGGLASVLVAGAALYIKPDTEDPALLNQTYIAIVASGIIGAVTFSGSFIAFGKLVGLKIIPDNFRFSGIQALNAILLLASIGLGVALVMDPSQGIFYWLIVAICLVLGLTLTLPIGGADMPVVIALLNSYSGIAAAAAGFVINNTVLIISGSLVGASGIVLTKIMCKAMNRSLANVMFASLGPTGDTPSADDVYGGKVTSTSPDEVAMLFDTAQRVVIVPGYGMAVSQAQHAVRDLTHLLEQKGINVEFAIHPVAGRMPGHMNVLLAEVNIEYEKLIEMDDMNSTIEQVDVAIVLGANDVVNPDARINPDSPIAGMPIIDVDKARTVVVIKRSLSPGFAGIPNPLFAMDNTLMLFSDGKKAITDLITAVKES